MSLLALRALLMLSIIVMLVSSCGRRASVKSVPRAPQPSSKPLQLGDTERGIASWYGDPYHGRRAANGEVYDMNELTAAHRTMPFGTWVRVDNETNGRHVEVRITDRGPFVNDRIIDLSRRAAEEIGMIGPGTARVRLTVIPPPRGTPVERYGVQVAALEDRDKAEALQRELDGKFGSARIVEREGSPAVYRVIVGDGARADAERLVQRLSRDGYKGFITRHVP